MDGPCKNEAARWGGLVRASMKHPGYCGSPSTV